MKKEVHNFYIPVMGTGFTIDTPLKVAKYGISSSISLVDDDLIEKMRAHYCKKFDIPYSRIQASDEDARAKRITAYLNLIKQLATDSFISLQCDDFVEGGTIDQYFDLLPENSRLKRVYKSDKATHISVQNELRKHLLMGAIDVNIMTKLDRVNYKKNGEQLPHEYNDAHAALRGFAKSDLESSVILSAGMNPRLYSYLEEFSDFYPDENGYIKKKIILKVSDYRSAMIQGKFLAKKGLWVSEYRVESGLNCGGHAFATDGYLLGPILQEFKENRLILQDSTFDILRNALKQKNRPCQSDSLQMRLTAQGGVGNSWEHQFLISEYNLDGVGWGTPFLLVPEVTNVDLETMKLLAKAKEEDLYLSDKSPLGVPFNSIRGNSKDVERQRLIDKKRPGSACPKKFLALNNEFGGETMCTASRQYQQLKIDELDKKELTTEEYNQNLAKIEVKECLCTGLAMSALDVNDIKTKSDNVGVSICPGPNMAYFSRVVSLGEMVKHIYGQINLVTDSRPNMFIKELGMYLEYFKKEIEKHFDSNNAKNLKYLTTFKNNLLKGIGYYKDLFSTKTCEKVLRRELTYQLSQLEEMLIKLRLPSFDSALTT